MGYVIGYNTPGYLPDTEEEPYVYDTADEAKRALIDEMLRHADNSEDALATDLSHAAEDLNLTDVSGGFSDIIYDEDKRYDLGTHYWIEPYEEG